MAGGVSTVNSQNSTGFPGARRWAWVHTHLFLLGTVFFLLAALFSKELDWARERNFRLFYGLYNTGLCVTAVMLAVRARGAGTGASAFPRDGRGNLRRRGAGTYLPGRRACGVFPLPEKNGVHGQCAIISFKNKSQRFSLRRTLAFLFSFFIGTPRKIIQGYPVKIGQRHQRVDGNRDTAQFIL